jgi:hypothetical protein
MMESCNSNSEKDGTASERLCAMDGFAIREHCMISEPKDSRSALQVGNLAGQRVSNDLYIRDVPRSDQSQNSSNVDRVLAIRRRL